MLTGTPVLMYHDVVKPGGGSHSGFTTVGADHYKLDESTFRDQMETLRDAGFRVPGVDGNGLPNQRLILSFDDGGVGAMLAADILEEFGFRGCFFVTTDRVGEARFLSKPQIRELDARGHAIGSHSASHPKKMSGLGFEVVRNEWGSSVRFLADCLGTPVNIASVPGGFYRSNVAKAAELEGVETLYTSEPRCAVWRVGNCQIRGRYTVDRETSVDTVLDLALGRNWKRQAQFLAWNIKKLGKTLAGPLYERLRKHLLEDAKRGKNRPI